MESKEVIHSEIVRTLDEIINLNSNILYTVGYGYTLQTLEGLNKYKSKLKSFEREIYEDNVVGLN